MDTFTSSWGPRFLSLLRIMTGTIFFFHGAQKLLGFPAVSQRGLAEFMTLPWWAGVLEFVGGPLIVLGLFTRPVAFVLSGFMAAAYFMAHAGRKLNEAGEMLGVPDVLGSPERSFYPLLNGGELAILYCFVFLYLFAAGPGPWSLDRAFGVEKATAP